MEIVFLQWKKRTLLSKFNKALASKIFCSLTALQIHSHQPQVKFICRAEDSKADRHSAISNSIMHAYTENHLKKRNLSQVANLQGIAFQTLQHAVQRVLDIIKQLLLSAMRQLKNHYLAHAHAIRSSCKCFCAGCESSVGIFTTEI